MRAFWQWVSDHLTPLIAFAVLCSSLLNRKKLQSLHVDLNSRLTQLLTVTGASERASGKAEGVAEGRQMGITELAARVTESERVSDKELSKIEP